MDSRDIIRKLKAAGWRVDRVRGSHHQFRHPSRPGTVTVPHPRKDLSIVVIRSIERQAGIRLR